MKRYEVQARHKSFKAGFMNLFADKRNFKTERYAKRIMLDNIKWFPELKFRVVQIEVKTCPECGHTKEA